MFQRKISAAYLRRAVARGESMVQISRTLGCHRRTVAAHMSRHGIVAPERLSEQYLRTAIAAKKSLAQIIKESKRSRTAVYNSLQKYGLRLPGAVAIGDVFHQLTVLACVGVIDAERHYTCRCSCGKTVTVCGSALTTRRKTHCGCIKRPTGSQSPYFKGYGELSAAAWGRILHNAATRHIPVEISISDAWELFEAQDRRCALSRRLLTFGRDGTASLDRIDSAYGYVRGNVQWLHKDVNRMKWRLSTAEFVALCREIADSNP